MWRRTALIVVVGLTLASRSKLEAQQRNDRELLVTDLNWVRFDVMMGRLIAVTNRAKQDRQRSRHEADGTAESLSVCIDRGLTSLQYCRESDAERLSIRVVRRDHVEIRREQAPGKTGSHNVAYIQKPGESVRVLISSGDEGEQVLQGPSIWHLMLADPRVARSGILDVLEQLKPDWHPRQQAECIRNGLLLTAPWRLATSADEVDQLVRQLGHENFQTRQRADRELRSRGRHVLGLLEALEPDSLDMEQRLRVREICRTLAGDHGDTPNRVTAWLLNDRRLWFELLDDDQLECRQLAHAHLLRLCDRPMEFDPAADPAIRSLQLAALRSQALDR